MLYNRLSRLYEPLLAPLERSFLSGKRRIAAERVPEGADVLEIGAGTGLNFRHPSKERSRIATDISCPMLRVARTKPVFPPLAACDAESLPFPDERFDVVFGTLIFCSVPDPARAFDEVQRVLKPNGKFIMFEHVRPPGLLGNCFDAINLVTVPLISDYFNRNTSKLAEASGLKIERVDPSGMGVFELIECRNGL